MIERGAAPKRETEREMKRPKDKDTSLIAPQAQREVERRDLCSGAGTWRVCVCVCVKG